MQNNILSIVPSIIPLLIAIICLYMMLYCAYEWGITFLLRKYGVATQAKVVGFSQEDTRVTKFFIKYTFKVQNDKGKIKTYTQEHQVRLKYANYVREHKFATVVYLPNKPSISRLLGLYSSQVIRNTTSVVAIIVAILFPPSIILFGIWLLITWFRFKPKKRIRSAS